jgi:DNA invertase Pin-like site-specific DNA recombinase
MSATNTPDLSGDGAAYIRVSDDEQDTKRQHEAIRNFLERYGVTVPQSHHFEDEGWARDTADRRPDFQRLMRLVEAGKIKWIVVDQLDRFGMKTAKQLFAYLYRLEEAGCRLYDATGKEWTGDDDGTEINAWVEGKKSTKEQHGISRRVLGGQVARAKDGCWQGGPVRLGFDVACYSLATDAELWRVVTLGRGAGGGGPRRLKVYPDGRTERFDGADNFPVFQPATEVLRIAPSRDQAKVDAAVAVFQRFATESVGFAALAHWLNAGGFRNSHGGMFQGYNVEAMLEDPLYLGCYVWNRQHVGKFHRYRGGQAVLELNHEERRTKNAAADWVWGRQLFPPLVDEETWEAVQRKLAERERRAPAPRSAGLYLGGLVVCGNCGAPMVGHRARKTRPRPGEEAADRYEYFCGSYFKAVRERWQKSRDGVRVSPEGVECRCLRNGVYQEVLEEYVDQYLQETGHRLRLLLGDTIEVDPTARLGQQEVGAWSAYQQGFDRLVTYLAEHSPEEYTELLRQAEAEAPAGAGGKPGGKRRPGKRTSRTSRKDLEEAVVNHRDDPTQYYHPGSQESDFLADALALYRSAWDPAALQAEVAKLEEEHTALFHRYADLPTPRARAKAQAELAALEAKIAKLEAQQQDLGEGVAAALRDLRELAAAIHAARQALAAGALERAARRRAAALRAVIQRIECTFTATGQSGGGRGRRNARLVEVTVWPVLGDPVAYAGALHASKGSPLM